MTSQGFPAETRGATLHTPAPGAESLLTAREAPARRVVIVNFYTPLEPKEGDALATFDIRLHGAITIRGCKIRPDWSVKFPGRLAVGATVAFTKSLLGEIRFEANTCLRAVLADQGPLAP